MSDLFTQVGADVCQPETTITPYNYTFNGSSVRVVKDESGEPWFVGKDVCSKAQSPNSSRPGVWNAAPRLQNRLDF